LAKECWISWRRGSLSRGVMWERSLHQPQILATMLPRLGAWPSDALNASRRR
jgi:hypothetical protein